MWPIGLSQIKGESPRYAYAILIYCLAIKFNAIEWIVEIEILHSATAINRQKGVLVDHSTCDLGKCRHL